MGDGNEGRIKLLGFIYIHVVLVLFLLFFSISPTVPRVGVVESRGFLGCIIPHNCYLICHE